MRRCGAAAFRRHDALIRKWHRCGHVPLEIAVLLNEAGLRAGHWAIGEQFVRARLRVLGLVPNRSPTRYAMNDYRRRSASRRRRAPPMHLPPSP